MSDSAYDLLRGGNPEAALEVLQQQVRQDPSNAEHRIFLFQLLSYLGDWDRALTQLNVAGDLDAGALGMVQVYRIALSSEALRSQVFAGSRTPLVFGEPEQWIALLLEALKVGATAQIRDAAALRHEAFDLAPASSGEIDGQAFEWIADSDMRLGPFIEVIMNGNYYWVPFSRISEIRIDEPADLRDMVWLPAEFKWLNGGDAYGLIPARYPGSELSEDGQVRVGRRTEWVDLGEENFIGLGMREISTNEGEYPLTQIRHIRFTSESDGAVNS